MTGIDSLLRRWIFRLLAVVGGLILAVLLAELAIRLFPGLLNGTLSHAAFSRYDTFPGGICVREGITRMRFLRADFSTRTYSHGYFWRHRTDELGFRNPPGLKDREVLLVGDSLVYGHGVDDDETLGHVLREDYGVAAYDISAQGQCLFQHSINLRLRLKELRPKTVLLFVFVNDVSDLASRRAPELLVDPPELRRFDYEIIGERVRRLVEYREPWYRRVFYGSCLVRILAKTRGWSPPTPPDSVTPKQWSGPVGPTKKGEGIAWAALDDSVFRPIETYYELVLSDLADRCRGIGARLVLIHLVPPPQNPWPARDQAQRKLYGLLVRIAGEHGIELVDTTGFFAGKTEWILPNDGHFNPEGNRALAGFLVDRVLRPGGGVGDGGPVPIGEGDDPDQ